MTYQPGGAEMPNDTARIPALANDDSNLMSSPIFTAQGLTKTYGTGETEVRALRGIDLEIATGEVMVLLGPSGSGKSTLLNIMGVLDQATSGRLFFKDIELTALDDAALTVYRRRHVGFVFQFFNLVPSLTAYENVALVTEMAEEPMRPDESLALVGLQERMHHFPAELSGGEQQRVAMARAIAKQPEVLLCDEALVAIRHHRQVGVGRVKVEGPANEGLNGEGPRNGLALIY